MDVEWIIYNVVIIFMVVCVSRLISSINRCRSERRRCMDRNLLEGKWLRSRINLIGRKQAALGAIIQQFRNEIIRENFSHKIVGQCEREALEKLVSKRNENLKHVESRLVKLEFSVANLRSKVSNMKLSLSSDTSSVYAKTSDASSIDTTDAIFSRRIPAHSNDNPGSQRVFPVATDLLFELHNDGSVDSIDTSSSTEEYTKENFNLKVESILLESLENRETVAFMILKIEDLALRYNVDIRDCLLSVLETVVREAQKVSMNVDNIDKILDKFKKLVVYFKERLENQDAMEGMETLFNKFNLSPEERGMLIDRFCGLLGNEVI